jgi:hypothetical protein
MGFITKPITAAAILLLELRGGHFDHVVLADIRAMRVVEDPFGLLV